MIYSLIILERDKQKVMKEFNIRTFLYRHIYRYIQEIDLKHSPRVSIPSAMFSLFMVFGKSFEETDSWSLIFGSGSGLISACIKFVLCFVLFYYVICYLYYRFNSISFYKTSSDTISGNKKYRIHIYDRYMDCLSRFPFRTAFLTLVIVYIPYIIISYPAIFMADTVAQIVQAYPQLGILRPHYLSGRLLSDNVYLNNHHPVTHTLLMYLFLQIGDGIFHSFNVGIFLFALLQFFFLVSAIAYGIKILVEKTSLPDKYIPFVILYYIISPSIQNYMFVLTKDVIYAVFVLYFILFLYLVAAKPERKYCVLFAVSGLGMILFRNEAKYILMISLPVMALLHKRLRKFFIKYWLVVVGFNILFFHLILPICNITPGSIREMLSVPFQQTARYVKEHDAEVTGEEREAIDAVLNYDNLAEFYLPDRSDAVKYTYNEDSTKSDLLRYFKVWFQMFLKHPETYIQAYINNYYYYFYPGPIPFMGYNYKGSNDRIIALNGYLEPIGADFSHPSQWNDARIFYENIRDNFTYVPPIILLMFSATYTWTIILLMFYGIYKKIPQALCMLIMPAVLVVMCLFGPCNGFYGRYLYPVLIIFPFMIVLYFSLKQK